MENRKTKRYKLQRAKVKEGDRNLKTPIAKTREYQSKT